MKFMRQKCYRNSYIQAWVGLVYVSIVCKSIWNNSDSSMVNTHVYVKCENTQKNAKIRV